ncbi:hypothetical protein ABT336_25560 [Micromonospora sp. NPDC000207]|uniref:hypothetical protein n=1 Tax=Micromonospora sp. NPDC000207 TaxID=3154246 RepID=UPI0033230F89
MTGPVTRTGLVVALVAAGTLGVHTPVRAAQGTAGPCPDASGVTVVVDFNELGGGTVVRCAPGTQSSGLTALKGAGFQVAGTLRWGEGFICRIEGRPSVAAEKCVDTPPASAYWSYWHAPDGGSWTYSDKGVLNRRPPAGSFEGWSFSLNRSPDDAPRPGAAPQRPKPPTRPEPTRPEPTRPAPPPAPPPATGPDDRPPPPPAPTVGVPGGAGPTDGVPPPPGGPTGGTVPTTPPIPTTSASTPPPVPSPTPPPGSTPVGEPPTDAPVPTQVTAARDTSGPPLGTLAGLLLLVAVAGGGIVTTWRRRRTTPDE